MGKSKGGGSDEPAIYVRTTPALKKVVTEAGNEVGESERWVVERLIETFMLMDEASRRDVLQGRLALDRVSNLTALVSWSAHAFAGHHTWAIECYAKLEEECIKQIYGSWQPSADLSADDRREAEEKRRVQAARSPLRLFARYRQAFSWSELSLELRKRAMSLAHIRAGESVPIKRINQYFAAAKESAKRAFDLYESVNNVHPGIAIICYNAACCAASRAMLLVESSLQYGADQRAESVTALCKAVAEGNREALEVAWGVIGKEWRKTSNSDSAKTRSKLFATSVSVGVDEIDEYGDLAIKYLNASEEQGRPAPSGVPWPDKDYFPYRFWDDTDIIFLRKDPKFVGQYEKWAGSADTDWLLTNYQKIARQFPSPTPM